MKITINILILAALGALAGCNDKGTQVTETTGIDPQLIGAWYFLDTMTISSPQPDIAFYGIQFNTDMTIQALGIETATGRVAVREDVEPNPIFQGKDGILIMRYENPPGMVSDTLRYSVEQDKLTLARPYLTNTYHKTRSGSLLSQPVPSTLSVIIDSAEVRSPAVGPMVPAYIVRKSPSQLELQATVSYGWITIDIDSFNGPGTYSIRKDKGVLTLDLGDARTTLLSDTLVTASITIDTYDDATLRCSGRFEFSVRRPYPYPSPGVRRLHDGTFSVPVYR